MYTYNIYTPMQSGGVGTQAMPKEEPSQADACKYLQRPISQISQVALCYFRCGSMRQRLVHQNVFGIV